MYVVIAHSPILLKPLLLLTHDTTDRCRHHRILVADDGLCGHGCVRGVCEGDVDEDLTRHLDMKTCVRTGVSMA